MIDKKQCPAHTRQPWGSSTHRYSQRLRYFLMALLTFLFFSIILALVINIALHFAWGPSSSDDNDDDPIPKFSSLEQQSGSALKDDALFQTCRGQFGGCKNVDKPDFCCPLKTTCRFDPFSPSGIHCCGSKESCVTSHENPPRCVAETTPCSAKDGGGCCPKGWDCSLGGYIREPGSILTPTASNKDESATTIAIQPSKYHDVNSSVGQGVTGGTMMNTSTAQVNSTTFISVKFGELALSMSGEAIKDIQKKSGTPLKMGLGLSLGISVVMAVASVAASL